ncbi:MAG: efflux RND transporter periplasmic adaptor subunit [Candidatus Komeilibacteria bacterium]
MSKVKIMAIVVIAILVTIAIYRTQTQGGDISSKYIMEAAARRSLVKTVSATGSVQSADKIDLNFSVSGRLQRINVAVGDEVKSGDVLARLDTSTPGADVAQARANVTAAQADLDKIEAGASAEDIAVTEQSIKQAQADLTLAQNQLASTESERDDKINSYRQTALNVLNSKNFYAQSALDVINTILSDTDAAPLLGVKNSQYITLVNDSYDSLYPRYNQINQLITATDNSTDNTALLSVLDSVINYQKEVLNLLSNTYLLLENSLTDAQFTTTELDSYKTSVRTQQTNLDAAVAALQTAKSNLSSNIIYYDNQVKAAQDTVNSREQAYILAQKQLALKKAGPRDFDVSLYQARLQQAQANLQTALANLSKYLIIAPLDGTITQVNKEVGEQANATDIVVQMIGKSKLEIEVDIPEADIAQVNLGDEAKITLDAYGSALEFGGHVSFIDPAETIIQDVVYYKVKVQFDLPDEAIKPGMTANIDILVDKKDDVLAVPSRSVYRVDGRSEVKILDAQNIEQVVSVQTGLQSDDGYTEIKDGLSSGQMIIVGEKNGN